MPNEHLLTSPSLTFPGETGEKVEAEMENDKGSEGPGTKEEETGEAVDLSVAT